MSRVGMASAAAALVVALSTGASAQTPQCRPETGTWCDAVAPACTTQIPGPGLTDCDVRVAQQWSFNEAAYCNHCTYTFYVLVECGREMHLPLADMEGASLTVTEVLNGRPATLRCLNDAAKGNAPEIVRCVGPGGRRGYGPPFDESSSGGTISWGFPDCVDITQLTCADVPAGGGTVDRASPGEAQVMDCYVSAPTGLCGLYRVDVESGGFEWQLFANCEGSDTPAFDVYFDCSEALAAFRPLPELAVANVAAQGVCPDVTVSFDLQNLGCADFSDPIPIRITSSCVPPQVQDLVVTDPVPANGSVFVSVPMTIPCNGSVTVEVDPEDVANPDGVILECAEDPSAASCDQASGVHSLPAPVACCTASITPRAPDVVGCAGTAVTLDGSSSIVSGCARPLYRWLDPAGTVLRDWDPSPMFDVDVGPCPAGVAYSLEVACEGEPCAYRTTLRVDCVTPAAVAGADVSTCPGTPVTLDASASSVTNCAIVEYQWSKDGTPVRAWDVDSTMALGPLDCGDAGLWEVEVRCAGLSCSDASALTVACSGGLAPPEVGPTLLVSRAGAQVTFDWPAVPGAELYRVLRGPLSALWVGRSYDHAADDAIGRGRCDAGTSTTWTDPDDGLDGATYYYLVVAATSCGGDGPTGFGWDRTTYFPRDPRTPTGTCP